MKKQKLPSKDWIGLVIDAIIRCTQKDFLARQDKVDIRSELSNSLFKDISKVINPAYPITFTLANCEVINNYEDQQVQLQIVGWQEIRGYKITIDIVRNNHEFWKAYGVHINYSY